jgi:hypothetical protein
LHGQPRLPGLTSGQSLGMDRARDMYPQHFAMLSDDRAELLEFLIAKTVFPSGWEPDENDIRDQCERIAGQLGLGESISRTLDRHPPPKRDKI